jgi:glycine cleavage system protein P-like pyridoxal-binding family
MFRRIGVVLVLSTPVYGGSPGACPAAVTTALAKAKPTSAEKPTAGKAVRHEIAFSTAGGRKAATFAADGKCIEEA